MTMMITKFHKLLASKALWIILFVIIVFSFVIWALPQPARNSIGQKGREKAGDLFDKEVTQTELTQAYRNTYLVMELTQLRQLNLDAEQEAELRKAAWARLMKLRMAEQMNIKASPAEVQMAISGMPLFFGDSGSFSNDRYRMFFSRGAYLYQKGYSQAAFERVIAEEVAMGKLLQMVQSGIAVAPSDVSRAFSMMTDLYDLQYALITPAMVEESVVITDEDVVTYYAANKDRFMSDPVRVAEYVEFDTAPFIETVTVTDAEVQAHYDVNKSSFVLPVEPPAEGEEVKEPAEPTYKALEDVREEIVAKLKLAKALDLALADANEFSGLLNPSADGTRKVFADVATNKGVKVNVTKALRQGEVPVGIDPAVNMNGELYKLTGSAVNYYTSPVSGTNKVYVIALKSETPSALKSLEVVKEDATELLRKELTTKAMMKWADELVIKGNEQLPVSGDFATFVAENKLDKMAEIKDLTMMSQPTDPMAQYVMRELPFHNRQEMVDPVAVPGGVMITWLADRKGDVNANFAEQQQQLKGMLMREQMVPFMESWQDYMLKDAGYVDPKAGQTEKEAQKES